MASARMAKKQWDGDGVPLEESNVAGIGSEEDKALRHQAAQAEPAWNGVGQAPGLWVWRIRDFKVEAWPKESYGSFYAGDSYIILSAVKGLEGGEPDRKIHFWLGESTTTDEKGTAAYKSVELDDFFHGKCSITREVMLHESKEFHGLFPGGTRYLEGGADSGFNPARPEIYLARLFRVRRSNRKEGVKVRELPLARSSLCQDDSFILDAGADIYVWNGRAATPFEKYACSTEAENMKARRRGKSRVVQGPDARFWSLLGGEGEVAAAGQGGKASEEKEPVYGEGVLFKISASDGRLACTEVGRGDLRRKMLDSTNLMMLDATVEVIMWIGARASPVERRNAMPIATNYLKTNARSVQKTAVHLIKEGSEQSSKLWQTVFAN